MSRLGEITRNNQGMNMKITRFKNVKDIDVEFEDGTKIKNARYGNFKNGLIKNYNIPTVVGVGVVGYGNYTRSTHKREYNAWRNILIRCYDEKYQTKFPTYVGCSVSKEFLNLQNFAEFYNQEKWTNDLVLIPDKDILTHGESKVYSRETILLVDSRINSLFTKRDNARGSFLIGVTLNKTVNKFESRCCIEGEQKHLGLYNSELEAFYVYKKFKENYIKQVAEEYAKKYPKFPVKLYKAMYEYEVNIDD